MCSTPTGPNTCTQAPQETPTGPVPTSLMSHSCSGGGKGSCTTLVGFHVAVDQFRFLVAVTDSAPFHKKLGTLSKTRQSAKMGHFCSTTDKTEL